MESKEVIELRRDVWKKAEANFMAAKEALDAAKQNYAAALCPFAIGDRLTGFDLAGTQGIIEQIGLIGEGNTWPATVRPFKKDGTPSQKVRNVYSFSLFNGKKPVRC